LAQEQPDAPVRQPSPSESGRRPILPILLGLTVIVAFGVATWYALAPIQPPAAAGEPPLIKAELAPFKEKPAEPGGLEIPNKDKLVFERLTPAPAPDKEEKLAPRPEEPVARPKQAEQPATPQSTAEPTQSAAVAPPPAAPPPPAAREDAPAAREDAPAAPSAAPTTTAAATAARQPAAASATPQAANDKANFRIQIAAYRSEETARNAWVWLRDQHKELLEPLDARIARVEIKGKGTFFRLQAGPFDDRAAARQTCDALKERKLDCIVIAS